MDRMHLKHNSGVRSILAKRIGFGIVPTCVLVSNFTGNYMYIGLASPSAFCVRSHGCHRGPRLGF